MTTSIDTNILAALWNDADPFNATALELLNRAARKGPLVIAGPVYAELMAGPLRTEAALDSFFISTGIIIDWPLDEAVWREAGRAYTGYVLRRRRGATSGARRILTDFLVGAHAQVHGFELLTLDARLYRAAFPSLTLVSD